MFFVGDNQNKMFTWINYQPGLTPLKEDKELYPELQYAYDFPPNYNLYGSFKNDGENTSIRIDRFEPITGYGYDPEICNWQIGDYQKQ